jgi:O-antigen/teichoic acid export membrane protein
MPAPVKAMAAVYDTQLWLKSALPFMFLGAMRLVNQRTDIIMLGFFRPIEEVGIYRAVVQGATLVSFVLISINMVLAPIISGLYTQGKLHQLQRLVTISARGILFLTLPLVLFLLIGGHWILSFLFGVEFGAGANALRILCAGQLINAVTGSVGIILNMTGHEKYAVRGVAVAAGANIVLNLLLIPQFGIEGAAAATATSLVIWDVLLCWWVYKHVGVVSLAFKRLAVNN